MRNLTFGKMINCHLSLFVCGLKHPPVRYVQLGSKSITTLTFSCLLLLPPHSPFRKPKN